MLMHSVVVNRPDRVNQQKSIATWESQVNR